MPTALARALDRVLRDLESTGGPLPTVEPSDWQIAIATAESAFLRSRDGSGSGVWVDTQASEARLVVMVADQAQEWVIEELAANGLTSNWPLCAEHPTTHPLTAAVHGGVAAWLCPTSRRPACEIGRLPGRRRTPMSVVPVDERDSGWEQPLPRFRVYLHESSATSPGGATWTYDVTGADVVQVVDWAQQQAAGRRTFAVALVYDDAAVEQASPGDGRGLVWLLGMDGNDSAEPGSPEWTVQQRMLTRRHHPVGVPDADRAPLDDR